MKVNAPSLTDMPIKTGHRAFSQEVGDGSRPEDTSGNKPPEDGPGGISSVDHKAKIITAFLLLAVTMTFGGVLAAYVVISTNGVAEWDPFALPIQVWISTAIIILSSVAYIKFEGSVSRDDLAASRKWVLTTTILGGIFISSQLLVWYQLWQKGIYASGNPYAGFFYILTAIHAFHVLGGIAALGSIVLKTWHLKSGNQFSPKTRALVRSVGWYWHFMGILWLVIIFLLGFFK